MLKAKYKTKEEIPAAHAEFYEERNGEWLLKVEGLASEADVARLTTSLTQERNAHKATKDELAGLKTNVAKLGDVTDFGEAGERLANYSDLEARAAANAHSVTEAQVQERIRVAADAAKKTAERKQKEAEERAVKAEAKTVEAEKKLKTTTVQAEVRAIAAKAGVVPSAVDDMLLLADQALELHDDGSVTTKDGISIDDWVGDLKTKKAHWWPPTVGANSEGGKGGEPTDGTNPWTAEGWNVTAQGRIARADTAKADRMAKAAGVNVNATRPKEPKVTS